MSVASVASQWTLPVAVADELESFFHVMLFYGVRYLPHTIKNVPGFVTEFFDTFQRDEEGRRFCSLIKQNAMKHKKIEYSEVDLKFTKTTGEEGNPINLLIKSLLPLFEARYKVLAHNLEKRLQAENTLRSQAIPRPAPVVSEPAEDWANDIPVPLPWDAIVNDPTETSDSESELSPKTVTDAAKLDTHKAFLGLLLGTSKHSQEAWYDTGVVGRDLLEGYDPRPTFCTAVDMDTALRAKSTLNTSSRASKRAKKEHSSSAFHASLPYRNADSDSALVVVGSKTGKGRRA